MTGAARTEYLGFMNPPPPSPSARPDAYQHWLDDAANMGLMLFRMRNDSKREGLVARQQQSSGTPPGSPPPGLSPTGRQGTPVPTGPGLSPQGQQRHPASSSSPIPIPPRPKGHAHALSAFQPFQSPPPQDVTPRTGLALQTATVATTSSGASRVTGTESTASSTRDQAPEIPSTFYREPHRHSSHSSRRSQHLD